MSRKPVIAANWKMNVLPSESVGFVKEFLPLVKDNQDVEIVLCPSATVISEVSKAVEGSNVLVGGQNAYSKESGAYTGENSVSMLLDLNCSYVILGHSERRSIFAETNEIINEKVKFALSKKLKVIVCVGETLEEREADKTKDVVKDHVVNSLKDLTKEDMDQVVIAYEPVWAIGTGKTATPEQAEEVHAYIRELLNELFGDDVAGQVRIQYGGSVKPANVKELMAKPNIDGALVGGASLKSDSFSQIVNFNR